MTRCIGFFFRVALMLSFAGCGQPRSASVPEISLPPASLSVWERTDASAEGLESGFEGLGDPAVQSASELIGTALEIYSWFAKGGLPLAQRTRILVNPQTGEEEIYQLVDSPYFSNREQLEKYLNNFFSEEIVQSLLERYPVCRDIEGELYMLVADEDQAVFLKDVAFSIEEETESFIRLSAVVSDEEDPKKTQRYEFVCQQIEGKWIFTTFAYDWQ